MRIDKGHVLKDHRQIGKKFFPLRFVVLPTGLMEMRRRSHAGFDR